MKFQLWSDLHGQKPLSIPVVAPCLALLGDVGSFAKPEMLLTFLNTVATQFERVLFVPGNHEWYSAAFAGDRTTLQAAVEKRLPANVTLLNNTTTMVGDVKVLGTTLWSHVPEDAAVVVTRGLNDYAMIWESPQQPISVHTTNRWHAEAVRFLEAEMVPGCVVLTHHAPLMHGTSSPQYAQSPWKSAFATNLSPLFTQVHTWAFGHTHWCCDMTVNTTRIVSNQLGYARENTGGFDWGKCIEV